MDKLKPCKCGRDGVDIMTTDLGIAWACLIGCLSINCEETVIRFGLTKNHAKRRAIRAWNRRMNNGKQV